jgi:hypothetical protein
VLAPERVAGVHRDAERTARLSRGALGHHRGAALSVTRHRSQHAGVVHDDIEVAFAGHQHVERLIHRVRIGHVEDEWFAAAAGGVEVSSGVVGPFRVHVVESYDRSAVENHCAAA